MGRSSTQRPLFSISGDLMDNLEFTHFMVTEVVIEEDTIIDNAKEEKMDKNRFENVVKFGKAVFQILEGVVNILKVIK